MPLARVKQMGEQNYADVGPFPSSVAFIKLSVQEVDSRNGYNLPDKTCQPLLGIMLALLEGAGQMAAF